jgi:tRNA A37 methylthiotransferase MiaB
MGQPDMSAAYQWADLAICRSGAMTVSELAAAGLPSILVPFPFAIDERRYLALAEFWIENRGNHAGRKDYGAYGQDRQGGRTDTDLWALVHRLLVETDVPRLRLSSIEPWDLTERAFALWDDPRLCRHLHLPLQSGDEGVLRRMRRGHTVGHFRDLVGQLTARVPGIAVTGDVIVGFPGEEKEDFQASMELVEKVQFDDLFSFKYSDRPGTRATFFENKVSEEISQGRLMELQALQRKI